VSISICWDTYSFASFPPTVVACIVVEAFSTVGGVGSFLDDLQKTCVACLAIGLWVVAFPTPRFCSESVSKPRLAGPLYHLSSFNFY
jgi:hypothetical protein